jgi:hypothetical protein
MIFSPRWAFLICLDFRGKGVFSVGLHVSIAVMFEHVLGLLILSAVLCLVRDRDRARDGPQ